MQMNNVIHRQDVELEKALLLKDAISDLPAVRFSVRPRRVLRELLALKNMRRKIFLTCCMCFASSLGKT